MEKKAILIVDDEAIILLSLKQTLRLRLGNSYLYETALNAVDGLAAITRLTEEGVEVVLLISDWLMPGMNGDEFLTRVQMRFPDIRLIMITGHADDDQLADLVERVEIQAFLRKPWNPERLFEAVEAALR